MPKIAVKNLVVTYQTRKTTHTVIDGLSVAFPSSKISVIIGESGSGKSTLIKIIAGVLPLNAGEVYFDDAVVTYLPPRERDISYVNQDQRLSQYRLPFGSGFHPRRRNQATSLRNRGSLWLNPFAHP